jgi:hypothetical protein
MRVAGRQLDDTKLFHIYIYIENVSSVLLRNVESFSQYYSKLENITTFYIDFINS